MKKASIIFPHQLFETSPLPLNNSEVFLVEEQLFFKQYSFHKQKIALMRAAMKFYENWLADKGVTRMQYISAGNEGDTIGSLLIQFKKQGIDKLHYIDPVDTWLEKRIQQGCEKEGIHAEKYPTPMFLNSMNDLEEYFADTKKFYQTDFYIAQRKKRNILLDENNKPLGGKWSFDAENRKRFPRGKKIPKINYPMATPFHKEAVEYVDGHFGANPGELNGKPLYPVTFQQAREWMQQFFRERFYHFGTYEDAMVADQGILYHSVLSPALNTGLLTPQVVLDEAIAFASENEIPLNSLEGFVRQVLGWREFIRAVYVLKGTEERTRNFWGFKRKIPDSFYKATTGIDPLDQVIRKVLKTGYCHHIERLMVLGNFMLLCEFDPDEVYRWFMEMFIDAWDWVMVPNVYGMSQFADGGIMATKPYISGSNYLAKMSDFSKGEWQKVWDGLFWRFLHEHRSFFKQNYRLAMLISNFDKMNKEKQKQHLNTAERFLDKL